MKSITLFTFTFLVLSSATSLFAEHDHSLQGCRQESCQEYVPGHWDKKFVSAQYDTVRVWDEHCRRYVRKQVLVRPAGYQKVWVGGAYVTKLKWVCTQPVFNPGYEPHQPSACGCSGECRIEEYQEFVPGHWTTQEVPAQYKVIRVWDPHCRRSIQKQILVKAACSEQIWVNDAYVTKTRKVCERPVFQDKPERCSCQKPFITSYDRFGNAVYDYSACTCRNLPAYPPENQHRKGWHKKSKIEFDFNW
jgi:hypothetical protein